MELRQVPEPTPGPGEVKIKVEAVGICGSDLHIYNWDIGIFGKPVNFDLDKVLYGEIKLVGSFSQKFTAWKEAIKLFSQEKIVARPLVTDLRPLEDWEEGFRKCFAGEAVKVVFQPQI